MRPRIRAAAIIVTTVLAIAAPAPCAAQKPVAGFWQLSALLISGDTVWITDADGREIKGRIGSITAETIALEGDASRAFGAGEVQVIRRRDPGRGTWTGAAVGAVAGLGVGIAACAAYPKDDPQRGDACLMAIGLAWMPGLGAGALVGAMFPGRKQEVYRAPRPGEGLPLAREFGQIGTHVRVGDTVRITDTKGRVAEGKVTTLQPDAISIDLGGGTRFAARDVGLVESRKRNSVKTGAFFGLAVGGGLAAIDCIDVYANPEDFPDTQPGSRCAASLAVASGVGAIVGAGLARLIPGKRQFVYGSRVYADRAAAATRMSIAPMISARAKGVAVAFSF